MTFMSAAQNPTAMRPEPAVGGSFRIEGGVAHFVVRPDKVEKLYVPHICQRILD